LLTRDTQKTLTYATWFGAQAYKQGTIIIDDFRLAKELGLYDGEIPSLKEAAALGKKVNTRMRKRMAGYEELLEALKIAGDRRYIKGLDGRVIPVSQKRLALLTLLQGNEAVVMKHAYVLAADTLEWRFGAGLWSFVLWVHDEFQVASAPEIADQVGAILVDAIVAAGDNLGLRLKLGAKWKKGETWADTH